MQRVPRHDLSQFGLSDMIECGRAVRGLAQNAGSMELAAGEVVNYFYQALGDSSGDKNCALVRCFKTHRMQQLPENLQQKARAGLIAANPRKDPPCLTLLATAGDEPAWNDRRQSAGHAVIPLETVEIVEQAPMISQLIRQMGLDIGAVLSPSEELLIEADERAYNVFHVEKAAGSPFIPTQQPFVLRYGIKSVLGFGGLLPSGDLFALIMFSRVTIPRETAILFRTLALSVKLVLLPFTRGPIFAEGARATVRGVALRNHEQEQMRSEIATLRLLIPSLEAAALYQTARLQTVIADLTTQGEEFHKLGERLSSMLESTSDAVFMLDRDWRFTYLNSHASALLHSGPELLGRNIWDEFPASIGREFWRQYHIAMNEGAPVQFQEHYPEPIDRWFEVHAFPSQAGIAVFFHDITDRRKAEAALLESEKLAVSGRLAASIAHEINNPLEAITNLLYLLDVDATLSDESRAYLKSAQHELQRVTEISTQTLRFYRQTTSPSVTVLSEVVDSVLALYHSRLAQASIAVTREYHEIPPISTYSGEVRQILANLIGNAIDAMLNGGSITLRLRKSVDWCSDRRGIRIVVADSGHGMSKATTRRIFEAFFTTKGTTGTGLGLWVTCELVRRNGGCIRVKSSKEGTTRGTIFSVFFPFENSSRPADRTVVAN